MAGGAKTEASTIPGSHGGSELPGSPAISCLNLIMDVFTTNPSFYQRKLGSNFRVTNDFLLGAIDYDEGW